MQFLLERQVWHNMLCNTWLGSIVCYGIRWKILGGRPWVPWSRPLRWSRLGQGPRIANEWPLISMLSLHLAAFSSQAKNISWHSPHVALHFPLINDKASLANILLQDKSQKRLVKSRAHKLSVCLHSLSQKSLELKRLQHLGCRVLRKELDYILRS